MNIFTHIPEFCNIAKPNILSYGCANGSECMTLKHLLPSANIYGYDIVSITNWKELESGITD
jgi:hypothetical protein